MLFFLVFLGVLFFLPPATGTVAELVRFTSAVVIAALVKEFLVCLVLLFRH